MVVAQTSPGAPSSAERATVLECRGLEKSYGDRHAVRGVGFEIVRGETYGLLGPNGAGKTTTISMICGLLARDAGEVVVDGKPLETTSTEAKNAIGYVPQDLAIYPDLTARENLTFFGRLYGMARADLKQRSSEILEITGLADRSDERTDGFSGGMKRRLNIGIALLHKPRLLVLDEPTVGVDPQSRNAILSSVETLSDEGMAVLYTTHYMEEAERLCDRVGIIDEGEVKAEGTRRELVAILGERDRARRRHRFDSPGREQPPSEPSRGRCFRRGSGHRRERRRTGPRSGVSEANRQGTEGLTSDASCHAHRGQGSKAQCAGPLGDHDRGGRAARARLHLEQCPG